MARTGDGGRTGDREDLGGLHQRLPAPRDAERDEDGLLVGALGAGPRPRPPTGPRWPECRR